MFNEKTFTSKFNRWLLHSWLGESAVFELKVTKTNRMPFSAVKPHQIQNLLAAKNGKVIYKIPDDGFSQKPFDCFYLSKVLAYVVVYFYKRGEKRFYMIPVEEFVFRQEAAISKSFTSDEVLGWDHLTGYL